MAHIKQVLRGNRVTLVVYDRSSKISKSLGTFDQNSPEKAKKLEFAHHVCTALNNRLKHGQEVLDLFPTDPTVAEFVDNLLHQHWTELAQQDTNTITDSNNASPQLPTRIIEGEFSISRHELVWDVLMAAWTGCGLDNLPIDRGNTAAALQQMAFARLIKPTSKRKGVDTIRDLNVLPAADIISLDRLYRALTRIATPTFKEQLFNVLADHATSHGDVSMVLYDATTLYFETDEADDVNDGIRRPGYSKERRTEPQVIVGLLTDRYGYPLQVETFEGNTAENTTFLGVLEKYHTQRNPDHIVVVADSGMLSYKAVKEIHDKGWYFIIGSKRSKIPYDLAFLDVGDGDITFDEHRVVDTITPRHGNSAVRADRDGCGADWDPQVDHGTWRAVWRCSAGQRRRTHRALEKAKQKALKVIEHPSWGPRQKYVVNTAPGGLEFDEKQWKRDWELAGLKGYVTNIPAVDMGPEEIVQRYRELWKIERAFRISKVDLKARPMFHHVEERIRGHVLMVTTALTMSTWLWRSTGITAQRVIDACFKVVDNYAKIDATTTLHTRSIVSEEVKDIIRVLKLGD